MYLVTKPSLSRIRQFIDASRELPFSYPEVGATRMDPPPGYTVDHNRVQLGSGLECFNAAVAALKSWKQFDLGWVEMAPADTAITTGSVVAIVAKHFGLWSINACRIVYVIEADEPVKKFGFAYGTLATHVERGEERFTIEWHADDNSVWYDILAFSRPNQFLVNLGKPLARRLQRRFARDSLARMKALAK